MPDTIDRLLRAPTRWRRFLCWFLGHRLDDGRGLGWSGIVEHACTRCRRMERRSYRI